MGEAFKLREIDGFFMRMLAILALVVLVAGCSGVSAQERIRIDQLYEHAQLMIENLPDQNWQNTGFSPDEFKKVSSPIDKLLVLEKSLGSSEDGNVTERITAAEQSMSVVMTRLIAESRKSNTS